MTRFLNHVVVWALVTLALALTAYFYIVGAPKASPGSRVAVAGFLPPARVRGVGAPRRVDAVRLEQRPARHHHGRLLQERGIHEGTSGIRAAAPSAIRKDAGVSRSSSSYQEGPAGTWAGMAQGGTAKQVPHYRVDWRARYLAEHRHVQRLLHQLARHVEAHETDWRAKQIAAAETIGHEAGADPWPNCPDPIWDGAASWDVTVACENNGNWLDSPGFYRCGLQFDPMWERRFGRLCP